MVLRGFASLLETMMHEQYRGASSMMLRGGNEARCAFPGTGESTSDGLLLPYLEVVDSVFLQLNWMSRAVVGAN
jgi:hypothetical protein